MNLEEYRPQTFDSTSDLSYEQKDAVEQEREIDADFVYTVRYPEGKSSEEGEKLDFEVANPQYEGDYAFLNLEDAIIYGFPSPKPIYIVKVNSGKVIEPHPKTAPGTVYVANGSKVEAMKVPAEFVEGYIDSVLKKREVEGDLAQKVLESTFGKL